MKELKLPLQLTAVLNKVPLTKNSLRAPLVARKELELFFNFGYN